MTALQSFLSAHWHSLAPREKTGLRMAATVAGAFLLWTLLLAPAVQTLQRAPAQQLALDVQLENMRRLQATALADRKSVV